MAFAVPAFLIACAIFIAFILSLALRPRLLQKLTGWMLVFSSLTGLLLYGLGYGWAASNPGQSLVAALKATNGTLWLFAGRESFSALCASAPWMENPAFQILFWTAFLSAVYVTASAVLNALGQRLLRTLRQLALPFYRVCLIYGCAEDALLLTENIPHELRPVLICPDAPSDLDARADRIGGVVWNEKNMDPQGRWLQKLGLRPGGTKCLEVICVHPDDSRARAFVERLSGGLTAAGIPGGRVHVSAVTQWERSIPGQIPLGDGGHLAVDSYARSELAARRLMEQAPPCSVVEFDANARCTSDFTALVIGFGTTGQHVLRCLIRNAQFEGGSFSAAVVDKAPAAGAFWSLYGDMVKRYHVELCSMDVDSEAFVELVDRLSPSLRYVVVCTGTEKTDREIVELLLLLRARAPERFPGKAVLARCGKNAVTLCSWQQRGDRTFPVLAANDLLTGELDRRAMAINNTYLSGTAHTLYPHDRQAREQFYRDSWYRLDPLSRLSSRASAAFLPTLYATAGVDFSAPDAAAGMLERTSSPEVLENLSRTEHRRWVAFHSSMGVHQMPREEFLRRIAACAGDIRSRVTELEELAARARQDPGGAGLTERADALLRSCRAAASGVRKDIPADTLGGIHVCMADWEELGPLWEDYGELDLLLRRADFLAAGVRCAARGGEPPVMAQARPFRQLDTDMVLSLLHLEEAEA